MSGNLGVYIICKNEEKLIRHCVEPVLKVFPQVKVIDLGSQDATLDILKDLGVQVTGISCTPGQYSDLKNDLAKSHEWVIHIDGDEIFTIENLQKMNTYVNEYGKTHAWRALRVGWNDLKCIHRRIYVSSNINGPKLYRPSKFNFIGDWPTEVLHGPRKKKYRQAKEDCDIWCWHGRFLERSSIRDSSREEKIKTYQSRFNYQWRYLGRKLPWNTK